MRTLALLIALFMMALGTTGVVAPDSVITIGRSVITPAGLYAIAALRIGIGLVLMLAAPGSRAPRALKVIGALVVIAGVTTPIFGVERTRAVLDWAANNSGFLRIGAAVIVAIGGFVAYAVTGRRRA